MRRRVEDCAEALRMRDSRVAVRTELGQPGSINADRCLTLTNYLFGYGGIVIMIINNSQLISPTTLLLCARFHAIELLL